MKSDLTDTPHQETAATGRRTLLHGASFASAIALLGSARAAAAAEAQPFPSHKRWRLAFVNHVTTNPFFVPTQYGIADACDMFGCDHQWTGSANADVAEMVNAINAAIAAKADAIAVPIVDPHAFDQPVTRALQAGIPVFSYNADAPPGSANKRLAYIGQDLYQAGVAMGHRIESLVEGGTVALFIATPGQLNIQPRIDGAQDTLKKSGKNYDIQVIATGATVNEELSKIKAFYLGHQDLKGMFAVDAGSTQGVAETMRQYQLAAKGVHAGGFDLLPRTLDLIKAGSLDFTIDQQPYLQGFYTVMEMFLYLASGGLVGPADINTGLKFITKDSVQPYLDTSTRYEGKSDKPAIVPRSGPIAG
ncbi:sugar ABC transporter substrate-binding protein [Acidisphaera sp. S103]|uniref:sugar ABC transporter substrate-binding protein n=1 Tax=Acidisphaera sp. S103 TaxID=1747223 RepID=UPI00131A7D8E|nr:sugar ABC transporter substrate-binding protein [Acidisphaera sp. S103]